MTLGDVTLDGVGQGVHTGSGGQALGHAGHHIGVNDSDLRDIVGVNADELALFLDIGDDVVDGDLGSGAGGGGHGDGEHGVLLRGGNTLQAADIGKLGVVDDDADCLGGIHGGTAADGHDAVCLGSLKGSDAVLHVLDGGVGLDLAVNSVGKVGSVQQVGDLFGNAELDQIGVRADKGFLVAAGGQLGNDVLDRAVTMVGNGVQNNATCHNNISFFYPAKRRVFPWIILVYRTGQFVSICKICADFVKILVNLGSFRLRLRLASGQGMTKGGYIQIPPDDENQGDGTHADQVLQRVAVSDDHITGNGGQQNFQHAAGAVLGKHLDELDADDNIQRVYEKIMHPYPVIIDKQAGQQLDERNDADQQRNQHNDGKQDLQKPGHTRQLVAQHVFDMLFLAAQPGVGYDVVSQFHSFYSSI